MAGCSSCNLDIDSSSARVGGAVAPSSCALLTGEPCGLLTWRTQRTG